MALEAVDGDLAERLHPAAALNDREAFSYEALQFDRANLRAVLFLLAALLGFLVVVEVALHAVGGALEEIDGRPQQVREVGLETRVISESVAISASKISVTAPTIVLAPGSGRVSGLFRNGRCP
jgi:hypothetical protein